MGHRLSKIYTRTGDDGSTGLGDGSRLAKDDLRVAAYGSVDELNSYIGILQTQKLKDETHKQLHIIQHDLFDLGGELSIPNYQIISTDYTTRLENWIDEYNHELPPLKNFILPGGTPAAAHCHVARTICRRAEREVVSLLNKHSININSLHYLNRLSDYLFVLARCLARQDGAEEVLWQREYSSGA